MAGDGTAALLLSYILLSCESETPYWVVRFGARGYYVADWNRIRSWGAPSRARWLLAALSLACTRQTSSTEPTTNAVVNLPISSVPGLGRLGHRELEECSLTFAAFGKVSSSEGPRPEQYSNEEDAEDCVQYWMISKSVRINTSRRRPCGHVQSH